MLNLFPLRYRGLALGAALLGAVPAAAAGPAEAPGDAVALVMFEEDGCIWCARWNAEVGVAYPKTAEGRAAPLRREDIHQPIPDDLSLTSRPRLTPTFVLVRGGEEMSRIEGYPGEDFFWPMLARMLDAADIPTLDAVPSDTGDAEQQ
ncbi:hypothetical protein [Roseivivax sp. CAU 1761]